jgi:hypothetical protein
MKSRGNFKVSILTARGAVPSYNFSCTYINKKLRKNASFSSFCFFPALFSFWLTNLQETSQDGNAGYSEPCFSHLVSFV